jgi:hypothetical protein
VRSGGLAAILAAARDARSDPTGGTLEDNIRAAVGARPPDELSRVAHDPRELREVAAQPGPGTVGGPPLALNTVAACGYDLWMNSVSEIIAKGAIQREEITQREQAWLTLRRRHVQAIAAASAAISLASYLCLLLALRESWAFLVLSPLPGLIAGALIALIAGGILRSMAINAVCQGIYLIGGLMIGAWSLQGEGSIAAAGPLVLVMMFIVSWPSVGGLLGHLCESFDRDHLEI